MLMNCSYDPHKYNIGTHIGRLRQYLDKVPLIMRKYLYLEISMLKIMKIIRVLSIKDMI